MEQWVDIADFPKYQVSNQGRIRNTKTGKILQPLDNKRRCMMVILHRDNQGYSKSIRRLVAEAFVPGRSSINTTPIHLDQDYTNCAADNLEWRHRTMAYEWNKQGRRSESMRHGTIQDVDSGQTWENSWLAAQELRTTEHALLTAIFNDHSHRGRYYRFI